MHRFIRCTQAPRGAPVFILAEEVSGVMEFDVSDYLPSGGASLVSTVPAYERGKRTLIQMKYDNITVREGPEEVMRMLAEALGREMYKNQEHKP